MPAIADDSINKRTYKDKQGNIARTVFVAAYWEHHPDGRRLRRRRNFPTKTAAETFLREVRIAAHEKTYCYKPKDIPKLVDFVRMYEQQGLADKRPSTCARNLQSIRFFIEFFGRKKNNRIDEITTQQIEAFQAHRIGKGLKPKTVQRDVTSICAMLECAVRWDLIDNNPGKRVPKLKMPDKQVVFLERGEQQRLIEAAFSLPKTVLGKSPCLPYLIIFAMHTGMRKGELFHLRWRDVDFEQKRINIRNNEAEDHYTKSGKERIVGLNKTAEKALMDWKAWFACEQQAAEKLLNSKCRRRNERGRSRVKTLDRCEPALDQLVFPSFRAVGEQDKALPQDNMAKSLKVLQNAAKLDRPLTMHIFRHTFAVNLARAGVPIYKISKALGHADTRVTEMNYLRFAKDEAADVVNVLA